MCEESLQRTFKGMFAATMMTGLMMASSATADTTLTLRGISDGQRTLIQVSKGIARISETGDSGYSLYDQAQGRFIDVEPQRGVYTEMDKALLQQSATQMAGMQEMMAAQMQGLPPEQRAMMEAQMGGMMAMPEAGGVARTLRSESRGGRSIAGVSCQSHALFDGSQQVAEVCMAVAGNSAIPAEDLATLTAMMDFMRSMTQAMPAMGEPVDPLMMSDLRGVPLELKGTPNGDDFTLESVSQGAIDRGIFEAYKTLRRQDPMQDAMGDGMGSEAGGEMGGGMEGMPGMHDPMMDSHHW